MASNTFSDFFVLDNSSGLPVVDLFVQARPKRQDGRTVYQYKRYQTWTKKHKYYVHSFGDWYTCFILFLDEKYPFNYIGVQYYLLIK